MQIKDLKRHNSSGRAWGWSSWRTSSLLRILCRMAWQLGLLVPMWAMSCKQELRAHTLKMQVETCWEDSYSPMPSGLPCTWSSSPSWMWQSRLTLRSQSSSHMSWWRHALNSVMFLDRLESGATYLRLQSISMFQEILDQDTMSFTYLDVDVGKGCQCGKIPHVCMSHEHMGVLPPTSKPFKYLWNFLCSWLVTEPCSRTQNPTFKSVWTQLLFPQGAWHVLCHAPCCCTCHLCLSGSLIEGHQFSHLDLTIILAWYLWELYLGILPCFISEAVFWSICGNLSVHDLWQSHLQLLWMTDSVWALLLFLWVYGRCSVMHPVACCTCHLCLSDSLIYRHHFLT